jgi:hypothetical protein
VSKAGNDDDIDKTIAAFLTKRQQADPGDLWNLTAAGKFAFSVDDPPPKTNRKTKEVKPGARTDSTNHTIAQVPSTSSVEAMEADDAGRSIHRKANQRTSKFSRPLTLHNPVGLNKPIVAVDVEEPLANSRESTSEVRRTSAEPPRSESCLKPGPTQQGSPSEGPGSTVHPLSDCPIAQETPDLIEKHIEQMEKNPGFAPSSEAVVAHRRFVEKARSRRSDSRSDPSDTGSPPMALSKGGSIAEVEPTIPKGLEISEVPVEAHDEGSSSDTSTEVENEWSGLTRATASVNAPPGFVGLEDQLIALIHGPAKRGPRTSVLDEIPSSSEAGCESSSEDLVLDEEEDLSKQPSQKRMRALSTTRPSPIEAEHTSGDEEDASLPVYMDTSHAVPDHPQVRILHRPGYLRRRLTNT